MSFKDTLFSGKQTINCRGTVIDISRPKIMGILNITPDSFYDGGRYISDESIRDHIGQMVSEGADIIDVGGYSSRPGASRISVEQEKKRIKKALEIIRSEFPGLIVSIDTFRSEIASFAVNEFGVSIINDISSGSLDDNMLSTAGRLKVPYIMMHMQGTPDNMQTSPQYGDITKEVIAYFADRVAKAKQCGITDIIVDPGFGFGKTIDHNFTLLRELKLFEVLECPIAVGISHKSMVYKPLGLAPDDALNGTTVLHTIALLNGAAILRVHDVKEALQTVKLLDLYHTTGN
jgi:dihydropteroate synthase